MPINDFRCPRCRVEERYRYVRVGGVLKCPECGEDMERVDIGSMHWIWGDHDPHGMEADRDIGLLRPESRRIALAEGVRS